MADIPTIDKHGHRKKTISIFLGEEEVKKDEEESSLFGWHIKEIAERMWLDAEDEEIDWSNHELRLLSKSETAQSGNLFNDV